jgi:hypothetical protein
VEDPLADYKEQELYSVKKERKNKIPQYLNNDTYTMCENLVKKYGNDLKKMSRDTKINRFQYTVGQLKSFFIIFTSQVKSKKK